MRTLLACVARSAAEAVELVNASQWAGVQTVGVGKPFTDTAAKWIWSATGAQKSAPITSKPTFYTVVAAAQAGMQALLDLIVDDVADIYLNGAFVRTISRGLLQAEYVDRPVTLSLAQGANLLSIRVTNKGGSAGLLASISSSDGRRVLSRTSSATWSFST